MSENINPHKINKKQQRQADHIQDKLEDKGMGQDEARMRAQQEAAGGGNTGGGNSGGEAPKHRNGQGKHPDPSQRNEESASDAGISPRPGRKCAKRPAPTRSYGRLAVVRPGSGVAR